MNARDLKPGDIVEVDLGDDRLHRAEVVRVERERATGRFVNYVRLRLAPRGIPIKVRPRNVRRRVHRPYRHRPRRDHTAAAAGECDD